MVDTVIPAAAAFRPKPSAVSPMAAHYRKIKTFKKYIKSVSKYKIILIKHMKKEKKHGFFKKYLFENFILRECATWPAQ